MRISARAVYASMAVLELALHGDQNPIQAKEIAIRQDIPIKFLEQILLTLKNGEFVRSKRGPGGGYTLARSPAEITVGEVIRFIDGPIGPISCLDPGYDGCDFPGRCAFHDLFAQVNAEISKIVDSVTFEDMKERTLRKAREQAQSYVYHI